MKATFLCKIHQSGYDEYPTNYDNVYVIYSPIGENPNSNYHNFIKIVEIPNLKLSAKSEFLTKELGYVRWTDTLCEIKSELPWRTLNCYDSWGNFMTVFVEFSNGDKVTVNIPKYPYEMSQREVIIKYPRLIAHLICESLGYFSPNAAANAIVNYARNTPFACEWYSHMCHCRTKDYFNDAELLKIGKEVLRQSFQHRKYHKGYMSEYNRAIAIIKHELENKGSTSEMLASWF